MKLKTLLTEFILGSHKEKPIPKSFNGKFFYFFRYHYMMLIGLNMLFILSCIPIVTIPSAICAANRILTKLVRSKVVFFWSDYWEEFKTDFLKRMTIWLLLMLVPFSLGFYAAWLGIEQNGTAVRLFTITIILLLQSWWYICMVLIDIPPLQNLKNALFLMAVEWKATLKLLLATGLPVAVCCLFPLYCIPIAVICLFSACQLISAIVLAEPVLYWLSSDCSMNPK